MGYKKLVQLLLLVVVLVLIGFLFKKADAYTSTDEYCNSCHVHDHSHSSWMESIHYSNCDGEVVSCVACHLPPKGQGYYSEKLKAGIHDLYSYHFKDSSSYNWQQKSLPEYARHHTFETSCIKCHPKLFPTDLSENGEIAHWHYQQNNDELHCVDCHINIGHGPTVKASRNYQILQADSSIDTIYVASAIIEDFKDFTETIPESDVAFDMVAVNGGDTSVGASDKKVEVRLSPFFIGRIEVSWDEYVLFLRETESEGRTEQSLDGISGATPPWGNPDQGWGMGQRPAITMTHHAATVYCRWLSVRTGKNYRLPTEAEWAFAAQLAYKDLNDLSEYVSDVEASTVEPDDVKADALGLKHLFGNVKEFCADTYTEVGYQPVDSILWNPIISSEGKNHVLKGGSFKSPPDNFRSDFRESTQHDKWMKTDPQIPKSIWWYSDCNDVGFRIVLSYPQTL